MTSFVPGLELARGFYRDVVRALVEVPHTACLIGEGSEVLGYDAPRSTDHEWGPRVQLFVTADEVARVGEAMSGGLPPDYRGYPTAWFSLAEQRVTHHVEISTLGDWLTSHFGVDPRGGLDHAAWLALPQNHLLQLTGGEVFCDDSGELTELRASLRWYPADVWLWLLASQWHLIANTEPLVGRALEASDQRGARLLVSCLCRLIMEMAFLQERRYRPYGKWFGTAFAQLDAAATLGPLIDKALDEPPSTRADGPSATALITLARRHTALGITEPVLPTMGDFNVGVNDAVRPYAVLNTRAFVDVTLNAIADPGLRNLVRVGGIDQLTHADDAMINFTTWPNALTHSYRTMLAPHDRHQADTPKTTTDET
ncbi:MAG: DUF4037 domain-containing protein [Pseudonocardiaceae bacterium]